jgi:hypothetical protein
MENKIEILNNTLLKLLVRRGSNSDRQNIVLSQGELGYTTDTKRLFVGDGQTQGGIIIGNNYLGTTTDVTTIAGPIIGDLAFDSDDKRLVVFEGGNNVEANWRPVGGVYSNHNNTITISNANSIAVGTLSANNFSVDALGISMQLDEGNRIDINATSISTNSIAPKTSPYLGLPGNVSFNNVNYNWPTGGTGTNKFLSTDITGNLTWANTIAPTNIFVASSAGQLPVGSIMPFVSSANAPSGWLLCNGQSVTTAAYPALSAVIGYSYGGSGVNFNVPNLIRKTLYGVDSSPASSTTYSVASGTNSTLSATGALYIIKAIPDIIVNSVLTVSEGLTAQLNGVDVTGTSINPLSGNISFGLPTVTTAQDIKGGTSLNVDKYGRITGSSIHPAGEVTAVADTNNTHIINSFSPIGFLRFPVYITRDSETPGYPTSFRGTLSAWPRITQTSNNVTSVAVPSNAKNLIIDCSFFKIGPNSGATNRFIVAAPNVGLLEPVDFGDYGPNEFLIGSCRASGGGDAIRTASQVIIPLSANSLGHLTFGFRYNTSSDDKFDVRIVGYTL